MGKQTRFHPVSLNIIRGAAEYSGFKLGKLRQYDNSEVLGYARYTVQILECPQDCQKVELLTIKQKLSSAFSWDVSVRDVWVTRGQKIYADLFTNNKPENPPDPTPIESQDWLLEGEE